MMVQVVDKIWGAVESALNDIENVKSYYVGGTLCIDEVIGHIGIGLNINGQGFIYNCKAPNGKVYQPEHITTKVNELYAKYKNQKPIEEVVEDA